MIENTRDVPYFWSSAIVNDPTYVLHEPIRPVFLALVNLLVTNDAINWQIVGAVICDIWYRQKFAWLFDGGDLS